MKISDLIVNSKEGITQIKEMQFGVFSSSEIAKLSAIECVNHQIYDREKKAPVPYSAKDPCLGVNQKIKDCPKCNKKSEKCQTCKRLEKCPTCKNKLEKCPGHFGYVRLNFPIFHIGFMKKIVEILKCICKNCSRILLQEKEKHQIRLKASKIKSMSNQRLKSIIKEISNLCIKVKICPYCGALNGKVKHIQGINNPAIIIHEIDKKDLENLEEGNNEEKPFKRKYESAILLFSQKNRSRSNQAFGKVANPETLKNIFYDTSNNIITTELTSTYVYNLFSHISPEDFVFFGMDGENASPLNLLIQYIIVPPLSIRPTVSMGFERINEDDLTEKISTMIFINKCLKSYLKEGNGNTYKLMDDLNSLQSNHAYYINSNTKGINKNLVGSKQIRSLCTRLKGKSGRFRGNLSGKRVDFSGRTVISPDPNLRIDQLGLPILMAMNLTYPERVNENNIKILKKMILNGADRYPGANFVITNNGETKTYLSKNFIIEKVCKELKIGDIVERHLIDDDIILFNRQPSLHRMSIMGFHVKVLPWRTMRFNESNCTPFNADFDGDEMNIHVPQTEEARSEVNYLMGVVGNIISPRLGTTLIASTQDFLAVCFLITQKDYFLDRTHFIRYCTYFNDGLEKVDIPPPTILKPKELWTGKQLFSVILKPNKNYKICINLKAKSKSFNEKYKGNELRCPKDSFVIIRNSELLTGIIDKATIGKESNSGLLFSLIKDCGKQEAAKFLTRISKFSGRWICDYGFSFGIGDITPTKDLVENKEKIIEENFKESERQIDLYNAGRNELKPGMNAEQSLESSLNNILSGIRNLVGQYLISILPRSNTALLMAISGSKGDNNNICQMIGCLGQQAVMGKRMPNGFTNRSLPHFEEFSKYPTSKGFIGHSFYDGLNAIELFFHTMGGREGIVDSSIKTADTGYLQRRLMKALEDITIQYNNTVAISTGDIIEFLYGGDGIEPMNIDTEEKIIYLPRLWDLICINYPIKSDKILEANEIREQVEGYISKCPIKEFEISEVFINYIREFFNEKIETIQKAKKSFGYMKPNVVNNICSVGEVQLKEFFKELWIKYKRAIVSPGEAVGAVAGQSIGEPATQMALKTFHFAGLSSMNIALGFPRIKEIIDFAQNMSTPVIYAELVQDDDIEAAKLVKRRIEKIKLNRICKYIKKVISPESCYIEVKLDKEYIDSLHLEISIQKVMQALLDNKKKLNSKLKEKDISIKNGTTLEIKSPETDMNNLYFSLESLMKRLPEIIVSGIDTVHRILIEKKNKEKEKEKEKDKYRLAVEGTGLLDIMETDGVDHKHCKSNNIVETLKTLGVEAARKIIIYELDYTFKDFSIYIDGRHLGLIADYMALKGTVHGFQRFGMFKMKDSVLLNASFENTNDILFNSGIYGKVDCLRGVSEAIIVGKTIPIGTGIFKLFMDKKMFNEEIGNRKNGMTIEEENENDDEKDFAKNKVQFNLYDMIK